MSEDYYESESESGTESEGDEYFYEDDSEEELEGGAYQLATDYIDGMGYGYGGVLMGGAKKKAAVSKNCISNYNLFFKKYRKAPYNKTPAQIGKMWREGKGRMPARKAPKGRKLCKNSKRPSVSGSKKSMKRSTSTKKKTVRKPSSTKRKTTRKGTFCPLNGRYYKTQDGYNLYCGNPKFGLNPIADPNATYVYVPGCPQGSRYCPITKTCRKDPAAIIDCYNRANIPYAINDRGIPSGRLDGNKYIRGVDIDKYKYPRDIYLRGKLAKKKAP